MKNITATITGKYFDDENTQTGLKDMLRYDQGHIEEYQFDNTDNFSIKVSLKQLTQDRWDSFGFFVVDSEDGYWLRTYPKKGLHNKNANNPFDCLCANCWEKRQIAISDEMVEHLRGGE